MKCPKCGTETAPYWGRKYATYYWKCPKCGAHWDNRTKKQDVTKEKDKCNATT